MENVKKDVVVKELPKLEFLTDSGKQVKAKTRKAILKQVLPKIEKGLKSENLQFELLEDNNALTLAIAQQGEQVLYLNLDYAVSLQHPSNRAKRKSRAGVSKKKTNNEDVPNLFK